MSSSQKVLTYDGMNHFINKIKETHIDKIATNTVAGHVKIGPISTPTAINGEGLVAPSYHTHPAQTEITGNAGTASKLKDPVNIALIGNVTGNADFDGSKDITINTAINKNGQAITGKTSLSGLEPGDYIENNGGKYTDSPNGSNSTNDFTISVVGSGNDKTQIFTDLVTGKVYIRIIENGTPSTWKEVLTISGGNIDANATSADKLKNARTISISGDAEGSTSFDGSKNVDIDLSLSDTGVDADTYGSNSQANFNSTREITIPSYTVDSSGRITSSSDQTIKIPESSGSGTSGSGGISPVTIGLSGDVSGSKVFDGTTDITINATLANSGVKSGTYGTDSSTIENDTVVKIPKLTVDAKGRVTSASNSDITFPSDAFDKVKTSPASSGIIYLSGKSTSDTDIGSELISPNLYYDVTNNTFHAGKIAATIEGVSGSADKLSVARDITLSGDVTGTTSFDGSKNVSIATTLKDSGATAGTYGNTSDIALGTSLSFNVPKITLNAKGLVTSASTTTVTLSVDSFNKVKSSPVATGKIYLSGKSDSAESTSTDVHNSNLYYDTDSDTLVAPNISGKASSASTADKLKTAVNISLAGDTIGTASFDGSEDISISTVLSDSGATAGSYGLGSAITLSSDASFVVPQFTVDSKGRITMAKHSTVTLPESAVNKVKTSVATAGIIYLSGKSTTDDNTDTEILNSNLYYDVTNNTFHAGKIAATIEGVSGSADKLSVARSISLSGDVSGTTSFDGSKDVSMNVVLANSGVTAGTYGNATDLSFGSDVSLKIPKIVISAKGLITSASMTTATISADSLNKVKASPVTTGKIYLSGKASSTENTSSDIMNSGLYYDVDTKTLVAPNVSGKASNASSADKLSTAVNIGLSGDATGSTTFDGSENVSINATLANSGVTAGTYGDNSKTLDRQVIIPKYTVDAKGRITSVTDQTVSLPTSADTASKLSKARAISLSGDVTGTTSFDGSTDVSVSTSLSNSGVTAGKYGPTLSTTLGTDTTINIPYITVDAKGRVTSAKNNPLTIPDNAFNTVKTDIAESGYIFISGKNELTSGNGTEVINEDLYYDVTNKILHAGKIAGTIEGVSDSANKLAKAVNINLVGAVTGSQAFDGSTSINITTTIETVSNEEIDEMMGL